METPQDVSLIIDGKVFKAKKDVLSEYSDYFRAMFSGNYVENEKQEITIDMVNADSMAIILKYMDIGLITLSDHSLSTIGELAIAANFLQITELIKQIEYHLEQELTLSNMMETIEIAQSASFSKLEQYCVIFGLFSFKHMRPEFIPTIHKLYWYLSHPNLNAETEVDVFKFGLQWIKHAEMGADALLIVLCCLDFNRLTPDDLEEMKDLVKEYVNSLLEKVVHCLFKLATKSRLSLSSITENKSSLRKKYTEKVYTEVLSLVKESVQRKLKLTPAVPIMSAPLLVQTCLPKSDHISPHYLYTFTKEDGFKSWLEVSEPNVWGWSVTSWGPTKIVVVCGEHGRGTGLFMRDVHEYDILKKEWIKHGVQLPQRRHGSIAVVGNSLFIIGGVGGFRDEGSSMFPSNINCSLGGQDIITGSLVPAKDSLNSWHKLGVMYKRKCYKGVKRDENEKFAHYNFVKKSTWCRRMNMVMLDSAIVYDLKQRSFRQIAKIPDAIQSPAICSHDNTVYAAGYRNIYKYEDFGQTDTWSMAVETEIRPNCLVSYKGYIYVTQSYYDDMYRFMPGVDTKLEVVTRFTNAPAALIHMGDRLLVFTTTHFASADLMTVEEYTGTKKDPEKKPQVIWSQDSTCFNVNDFAGKCSIMMTIPPLNPEVPPHHKRYLNAYEKI